MPFAWGVTLEEYSEYQCRGHMVDITGDYHPRKKKSNKIAPVFLSVPFNLVHIFRLRNEVHYTLGIPTQRKLQTQESVPRSLPRRSWLKVNPRNLHFNVLNGFNLNKEVTTSVQYYIKYHRVPELKILPKSLLPFLHSPPGKNDWIMNPNTVWVGFYGILSQSQKP